MSQVQPGRQIPAIDQRPVTAFATTQGAVPRAEAFQTSAAGLQHFVRELDHQQVSLPHYHHNNHDQLTQEQLWWQAKELNRSLLNGEALAQLSLELAVGSGVCELHATPGCFQSCQLVLQSRFHDLSSPVSLPSPGSISSQESTQAFADNGNLLIQNREAITETNNLDQQNFQLQQDMPYVAMVDRRGPTTPQSLEDAEFQNMQHLVRHNAATPYSLDDSLHPGSGQVTAYGSPASNHWGPEHFDDHPDMYQPRADMTMRYEWSGSPERRAYPHPQHYTGHYPPQRFGPMIPPSPAMSDRSSGLMPAPRVRPQSKSRSSPTPPPTKPRKAKAKAEKKVPRISQPLSILTRDMTVPIRDMEKWVTRSTEERMKEKEKRNRIARPMNSFMLYRSAYAERTKQWCSQNNHQVVSSVSGDSWPMEPDAVKEYYTNLAKIERDNHQKAHPDYKFTPSKANTAARKRKGNAAESDDELETEYDGSDYDWTPTGRKVRAKQRRRGESNFPEGSGPYMPDHGYGHPYPPQMQANRSTFQFSNPNRPLPMPMEEMGLYGPAGHYYAQQVRPSAHGEMIQDVRIHKTPAPGNQQYHAPSGLPGANHDDLFGADQNGFDGNSQHFIDMGADQFVDPNLMLEAPYGGGNITEESFKQFESDTLEQSDQAQSSSILEAAQQAQINETEGNPWDKGKPDLDFKAWMENFDKVEN